jgi:hypothetical protein
MSSRQDAPDPIREIKAVYDLPPLLAEVTVLPLRLTDEGGLYSDDSSHLVQFLKADKVQAAFLHSADQREYQVLMGETPVDFVIAFLTHIAAIATWDTVAGRLQAILKRRHGRVKIVEVVQEGGTTRASWFEVEGDGDTIANAMRARAREVGRDNRR